MNLNIVNLESHSTPKINVDARTAWIPFGENNDYPQYLIDRFDGSTTNNTVITGISQLIYGKGMALRGFESDSPEMQELNNVFSKKAMRKIAYDFKAQGQAAMQIIYNEDKSYIAEIAHMPVETLRMEKMGMSGEVEGYYYSADWKKYKKEGYKPNRIPAFGYGEKADKVEILYIKDYRSGQYYYSTVDYQGGLGWAQLEQDILDYHINNVNNGFSPTTVITVTQPMSEEDEYMMNKRIEEMLTGTTGKPYIIAYANGEDEAPKIDTIDTPDKADVYKLIAEQARENIMMSHRVTSPMLLGIKDNSGLGNNADEIKQASILFQNTVIRPLQETILDAVIEVLEFNGMVDPQPFFKTLQPLEFTEDVTEEEKEEVVEERIAEEDAETPNEGNESDSNDTSTETDVEMSEEAQEGLFKSFLNWFNKAEKGE